MGKKGPLWWRESDWLLRGSAALYSLVILSNSSNSSNWTKISSFLSRCDYMLTLFFFYYLYQSLLLYFCKETVGVIIS